MTATHSCFWALLSSEDFSFIYISNNVRRLEPVLGVNFIGSQLYGIVLPTEVPRMRKDLNVFKISSSFNGAAIRCSAYNFATIQDSAPYQYQRPPSSLAALNLPYSTYTLMIQAITSQVTMAMFHIDEDFLNKKMANSKVDCFHNYDHSEIEFVRHCLDNFELSNLSNLSLNPFSGQSIPNSPTYRDHTITPTRSFLVYDTYTPRVILAWPKNSFSNLIQNANQAVPTEGLDLLLHRIDSERLYKGFNEFLQTYQLHRRISFLSQVENYTGDRLEQVIYCIGNIAIACSQTVSAINYQAQPAPNSLNNSRSLSFSRGHELNNEYEIHKKMSAPVLMDMQNNGNGFYQQPQRTSLNVSKHYGQTLHQNDSPQTLHRVRSTTLLPVDSGDDLIPKKSVSNESMIYHSNRPRSTSTSVKGSSKLFSFLPSLPHINMNLLPLKGRNNNKSNRNSEASLEKPTLPPISYMTQSMSHPENPTVTSLPSFNHLVASGGSNQAPLSSPHSMYTDGSNGSKKNSMSHINPNQVHIHNGADPALISPLLTSPVRQCLSCHTTSSPEWRRGPRGQKTLCNACGLKYSRQLKALRMQNRTEVTSNVHLTN